MDSLGADVQTLLFFSNSINSQYKQEYFQIHSERWDKKIQTIDDNNIAHKIEVDIPIFDSEYVI